MAEFEKALRFLNTHKEKGDLSFLLGNGINRYSGNDENDWEKILIKLHNKRCSNKIDKSSLEGMSLTEFYETLALEAVDPDEIKTEFLDEIRKMGASSYTTYLTRKLISINVPVLTTNFDHNLEQGLTFYKMKPLEHQDKPSGFTDYYPWDAYWSNQELTDLLNGFGVWHINGTIKYKRSIMLGLSDYIRLASRAKSKISKGYKEDDFGLKNVQYWNSANTWLHVIFNSSLVILGLGLDRDEVFLRWLLLERKKYFNKFPDRIHGGCYICLQSDMTPGKRAYLDALGFDVFILENYSQIYKELFDRMS